MSHIHVFALVVLILPATASGESPMRDSDYARDAVSQGRILPLAQVLDNIQRRYPGRIIEVELDDDDGIIVYEIELITSDGRYFGIEVDAVTGAILEFEEDD